MNVYIQPHLVRDSESIVLAVLFVATIPNPIRLDSFSL